MEIELNLKHRCVETAIKKEYDSAVSSYFKKTDHKALEEKIEVLKKALETLDFRKLRSTYSELCAGTDSDIVLSSDSGRNIKISINDLQIKI